MKNFKDFVESVSDLTFTGTAFDVGDSMFKIMLAEVVPDPRKLNSRRPMYLYDNFKFKVSGLSETGAIYITYNGPSLKIPDSSYEIQYFVGNFNEEVVFENSNFDTKFKGRLTENGLTMDIFLNNRNETINIPGNNYIKKYLDFLNFFEKYNDRSTLDYIFVIIKGAKTREDIIETCKQIVELYTIGGKNIKKIFAPSKAKDVIKACEKFKKIYEVCKK